MFAQMTCVQKTAVLRSGCKPHDVRSHQTLRVLGGSYVEATGMLSAIVAPLAAEQAPQRGLEILPVEVLGGLACS